MAEDRGKQLCPFSTVEYYAAASILSRNHVCSATGMELEIVPLSEASRRTSTGWSHVCVVYGTEEQGN